MASEFHPTFEALVAKLKDDRISIRDIWPERYAWHKAGCPIEKAEVKPDTAWEAAYRCYASQKHDCRICGQSDCFCSGYTG